MRVLVIGGTGYMGHRILEGLVQAGHEVSEASRGNLTPEILKQVRHFRVDRKDRESFESRFKTESFDAVIDNIAYDRDDIESDIRAFGGRVRQFILTSTMAVYHDTTPLAPLREEQADLTYVPKPGAPGGFHPTLGQAYGIAKRQVELLLHGLDKAVFECTILRPPIVVGPDDRTRRIWWFVQRILDGGPLVIPDWGPGRLFQVVFADDLARAYVAAVGNPATYGRAYNVAQPEIFTAETWIQSLAEPLGRSSTWERIPEGSLEAAGLPGYIMPIAGRPFGNFLMDTTRLRSELAFTFTPGPDWLAQTAQGCAERPPAQDSDGYARRADEIAAARRLTELRNAALERFLNRQD